MIDDRPPASLMRNASGQVSQNVKVRGKEAKSKEAKKQRKKRHKEAKSKEAKSKDTKKKRKREKGKLREKRQNPLPVLSRGLFPLSKH